MHLKEVIKTFPASADPYIAEIKHKYKITDIENCNGAIIFGAELVGTKFARTFKSLGIQILAISDNNKDKWGQSIDRRDSGNSPPKK